MKLPRALCWICLVLALAAPVRAADVSATAVLSRERTSVGRPVMLQIRLEGTRQAGKPPDVRPVEGLEIQYRGPSTQVQMNNFDVKMSVTHIFQVLPQRQGTFTIPAAEVEVEGQRFKTAPLTLTVDAGAAGGTGGEQPLEKIGFAEIVVPKKTAFVGEAIPVEVRLCVNARVNWQLETMPQISGDGFTKTKMQEPRRETTRRDGQDYNVLVFRTAITPGKAGRIALGPAEFSYIAQVPRPRRERQRSIFDMFDDDAFGDPLFAVNQRVQAKAEAAEIEVKPLPVQGRPESFAGAVGDFKFTAEGSPAHVKMGDPVTMRLRVSGRGNFDRVEAPVFGERAGWRSYPPSSSFKADDDIGISGTKTFEMAVIPEAKHTAMPAFVFSYFDPVAEQYRQIASQPGSLTVEGGAAPAQPPKLALEPTPEEKPKQPAEDEIVGLRYDFGAVRSSFAPLYARREFLLAQLVPLGALLVLILRRAMRKSGRAREVEALRREKAGLWRRLRAETGHAEFFDTAAHIVQLDTALATGRSAASIDAATVRESRRLDDALGEEIEAIFSARAALLYAGGGGEDGRISKDERARVMRTLEQLEKTDARA